MDHRARLALEEPRALSFTSTDRERDHAFPTCLLPIANMTKKRRRYPDLNQKLEVRYAHPNRIQRPY